jgi:hypothetical protein
VRCERRCAGEDIAVLRYTEAEVKELMLLEGLPGRWANRACFFDAWDAFSSSPEQDT